MKKLNLGRLNGHSLILGKTRYGKTYLANRLFQNLDSACLYIDIEDKGEIDSETTITANEKLSSFRKKLQNQGKIRFVPSEDPEKRKEEIGKLWLALKRTNVNVYVFVDELHLYGNFQNNFFDNWAVRGLKYGVHLVGITQRPQFASNTILTQSNVIIAFDMDYEDQYLKRYNIPLELVERIDGQIYHFSIFKKGQGLTGPYRIEG